MMELPRFLVRHALIGFCIAVVFVAALLVFDLGGLRTLAAATRSGWLAATLLALSTGLTFASLQMGFAVMLLGQGTEKDDRGRRNPRRHSRLHRARLVPAAAVRRLRRKVG